MTQSWDSAFRLARKALFRVPTCLAVILVSACGSPPRADLIIANGAEPESLDPAIVTGVSEMRITKALFEGLLRLDGKTAQPVPALAESWRVSDGGKTYVFRLRTNAVWSTGEPISTADVVFSWVRALSPATAADYAGQLFCIENAEDYYLGKIKDPGRLGIRARGPYDLEVRLAYPLVFFPDLCCFPTLAVVPRQAIEKHGDRWLSQSPLPCSGPYTLEDWRLNDRVRLRRNPLYWDAGNTRNTLVDMLSVSSPNTALNFYETGQADVVWDKDLVPTEVMDVLRARPDFHSYNYLGTYFYRFNVTRPPFTDARVRRAFALATDKERIVRKLTLGGEKPAHHFVPTGVANYVSPSGLAFDPEAARALLASAGFTPASFPSIQYSYFSAAGGGARMQGKIAVELQQMWRDLLGVQVELRQIERKVFYSAQSRLDYDISASSWVGDYNDANTFLDLYLSNSGNNRTGWRSAEYDGLIRRANMQTDLKERARIFQRAERLLIAEEVPIVPLYFYAGFNLYDTNRVEGIYPNILDEHPLQEIRNKRLADRAER